MSDPMSDRMSDRMDFGHLGISFLISLNQQLFRNIPYVWYSWHFNKAVFVYLYLCICICICVFVYLTVGNLGISFLTFLNQQLFRNIAYVWYSWHFNKAVFVYLYLCICICICVFAYLTVGHLGKSF